MLRVVTAKLCAEEGPVENSKRVYASYMLRLWQVRIENGSEWTASMQSTATGELRAFASVDALVQFLQAEYGGTTPDSKLAVDPRTRAGDF